MAGSKTCPKCGAELPANAPRGICPKCLMRAGLDIAEELHEPANADAIAATTPQAGRFVPPEPKSLAPHFPQLEIRELVGQGGMGAVYKARQTKLDRLVALKIIRPESADDPSFAERFNREARTLARLNHPSIVAVHDFGEVTLSKTEGDESATRTLYYFLMEYVDGANLRQLLQGGELKSEQALSIVPQICEALQFAHDEGIVHRDIKPENILVDARGRVKIADFGLAKLMADDVGDYTLTGTNQVMGTPRYMAPEQMEGSRDVDHRADIYSLGVVFYEMLTGELPLGRFEPPSQKAIVDVQWDEVVLRALEKEPRKRYQHASEVKSEVERVSNLDRPPVRSEAQLPGSEAVAQADQATIPHYGIIMMAVVMASVGLTLILRQEAERTHLFMMFGMLLALGGGGCAAAAFSVRLPRATGVVAGRLMQGGILVFMGSALLLFCYLQNRGWFVGNPGIWIGIGLTLGGGGFFIGAWNGRVKEAEPSEHAGSTLHKADALNDTASFGRPAQLLHGPSIGLIVAGAMNCLCMLPWAAMAYRGINNRGRLFGSSEEYVMIWLFVSAVAGTPILFAALKMRQVEAYRLSIAGAIMAVLPLTPGSLIGIPMGLWALATLTRKDVRRAFGATPGSTSATPPKADLVVDTTPRFSRKAIVGACWAPFFFLAVLPSVLLTRVETSRTGVATRETVSPDGRLVKSSGGSTEEDLETASAVLAWWQWMLIATVLPLGLSAPFGTTILGLMSISNIRHSRGRLIGMPLAVADALLYPLLMLDLLILGLSIGLIFVVFFFYAKSAGFQGMALLAVGGPAVLIGLPACAAVDFLIVRAAWRRATIPADAE